jgi:S-adenosylmethionine-diacylglycerol 3-amino-3-carboxypropyl transferase
MNQFSNKNSNHKPANFLRYANCWEDADILLEGLQSAPGAKILSIGSAGDNSFSLLTTNPEIVVAIDMNEIQLHLIALKKAAIDELSHEEVMCFLGFKNSESRLTTFEKIKSLLEKNTCAYWEKNIHLIKNGIVHQAKFEQYFQLFVRKILPLIHSRKTTKALLAPKTSEAQIKFYNEHWNTWRWRLLFKIFFGKYVMGKYGRSAEFLKEVKIAVGPYIFNKAEAQLKSISAQNNFILHYNLLGDFGDSLPHYIRAENFELIKSNIRQLKIMKGLVHEIPGNSVQFDCMNLSDIFEYMDASTFHQTGERLIQLCSSGGKLAYWNLMVSRMLSTILPEKISFVDSLSSRLSAKDKGFFYNRFIIDQKK